MLPEFRSQFFQLPLISTTWECLQNRYAEEKRNSSFPIRFILAIIEQTLSLVHLTVIQPLLNLCRTYVNKLDQYLCSRIDSIRYMCPIIDRTSNEVIECYSDKIFPPFIGKTLRSSSVNSNSSNAKTDYQENQYNLVQKFFGFVTNSLMTIAMYSTCILHELNEHINASRKLWKKLNLEDGRSLDDVDLLSEKLLILGRRMIGNCRQFIYLIRYRLKRCRHILFSLLYIPNRFRKFIWYLTRKIPMNQKLNNRARHGLVLSKKCFHHYLDIIRVQAARHPWIKWTQPEINQTQATRLEKQNKTTRPIFFLSSNNTSDCSEPEDNHRDQLFDRFQSTPHAKNSKYCNIIQHEDALSDISSSLSSTPEQSFNVKDILRQIGSESSESSDTHDSIDQAEENRFIQAALNDTDTSEQQQQQDESSVFDLSAVLASGCAV